MQTAAIPYRFADFLKQHPPFQFMDEAELLGLAARGRVKFHEPDEYICWQASPHAPYVFVIQHGSVSLWDESTDPPVLRDILGVGDTVGIERFNGITSSPYSAKAASEVLLYAIDAGDFEAVLSSNARVAQYVTGLSAIAADYVAPGERTPAHEMFLGNLVRDRSPLLRTASTPIREAARLLSDSGAETLGLMEGAELAALLTSADLIRWIAEGAREPEQPARNIARGALVTVTPQTLVSDCVLELGQARAAAAAVTSDGTAGAAVHSTVTVSLLAPAFGDHPIAILQEIAAAATIERLRALHTRARAWLSENLSAPTALDWLARWSDLVNRRIVDRVIQLNGDRHPERVYCFYGAAGRQELLTFEAPRIAVIGPVSPPLAAALAECGYLDPEEPCNADLAEWKTRFSGWIRDPIRTQVYQSRPFFDLRPLDEPGPLLRELESHIRAELAAEPAFLRILANDCLSILPPLTFFRDLVVEESGEQSDTFRLESSALQPLVDVARVFSLASGTPLGASTHERFLQARRLLPAQEKIFREAAETTRVVLFQQARAGLRLRTDGAELPLSMLSRHDRHILKIGFRAIHNLLEFTAPCDWLETL